MRTATVLAITLSIGCLTQLAAQRPRAEPGYKVNPDRTVTFSLKAGDASSVEVGGDFADNNTAMKLGSDGAWTATVGPLRPAIYNYRFIVNGVGAPDPGNPILAAADRGPGSSMFQVPGDGPSPWDVRNVPHGSVEIRSYNSKKFGGAPRMMYVYTPPGYATSGESYPTLYLMHGAGGDESSWFTGGRANIILDNLIAAGNTQPMLIVMPYGRPGPSLRYGPAAVPEDPSVIFPNDVVEDVVPYVEANFRVRKNADNRAIAGLSMGGNQTLLLGLDYPDVFHSIGAFSPVTQGVVDGDRVAYKSVNAFNSKVGLFYIYIGDVDPLYQGNIAAHEFLDKTGIKHEFVQTKEGHVWRNWRDYLVDFAPRLFR